MTETAAWTSLAISIPSGLVAIGGLVHTIIKTNADQKAGIAEQEQVVYRDGVAERDALIDQVQELLAAEQQARTSQNEQLEKRAARLEDRIEHLEAKLQETQNALWEEKEYTAKLQHHIYTQKPPPPPGRHPAVAAPVPPPPQHI